MIPEDEYIVLSAELVGNEKQFAFSFNGLLNTLLKIKKFQKNHSILL